MKTRIAHISHYMISVYSPDSILWHLWVLICDSIEPISDTMQDLLFHWQPFWLYPWHANNPLNTLFTLPMQIDPLLHHMCTVIYFAPFNNAIKLYCAMKRLLTAISGSAGNQVCCNLHHIIASVAFYCLHNDQMCWTASYFVFRYISYYSTIKVWAWI